MIEKAKPVRDSKQSALWVLYGKSASGKTTLASTFPKPLLYLAIGDDGQESIRDVEGVYHLPVTSVQELNEALEELQGDTEYVTILVDTFGLVVNEWIEAEVVSRKKKMTQQAWGELKTDTEALIRKLKKLAQDKIVVLTCHEVTDIFEGTDEELTPDVRPNISKGARTYLEGMANFGIHCTVVQKEKPLEDGTVKTLKKHAVHLDSHPYYWVKTQKPASIRLPSLVLDPTYDKIIKLIKGK